MANRIRIMDTTLRDGEQTPGVNFTPNEKLTLAQMLLQQIKADFIEIASARVSLGEEEAVKKVVSWAKENQLEDKVEILGLIDGTISVDWIDKCGGKVMNILAKGSLNHLTYQLKKTPQQHIEDIKNTIQYAHSKGIKTNIYLEDWSNGMLHSQDYVHCIIQALEDVPVGRIMLTDTLGILLPKQTFLFCSQLVNKYPWAQFDFHAHNDYDLAVANTLSALEAGITGVHTTLNGLGERTGNTPLSSIVAVINDHTHWTCNVKENRLYLASKMAERISTLRISHNRPVVGDAVFTQCSGVHADGDSKKDLYCNKLDPKRFGRERDYALGKTSGKANIDQNLKHLGIHLSKEDTEKVTQRIIELGDKKNLVTVEDLPYIIADVLKSEKTQQEVILKNYSITHVYGLKPTASVSLEVKGQMYQASCAGDGQFDAFVKAVRIIYQEIGKTLPTLSDYWVTIPPGGKSSALTETIITWQWQGGTLKTRGLDCDQTSAAILATLKMLNALEVSENNKEYKKEKVCN